MKKFLNWLCDEPTNAVMVFMIAVFIVVITALCCERTSVENYDGGVVVEKSEHETRMTIRVYEDGRYSYRRIKTTRYEFDLYNVGDKIPEYFER